MRPVRYSHSPIATYIVRYTTVYQPHHGDILVLSSGGEAVDQFRLLCSFWFKSFFHEDRNYVEHLCRSSPRLSAVSEAVPRDFVQCFFDVPNRGGVAVMEGFTQFVDQVIGMPRKKYRQFMTCMHLFFGALEAISTDFDLAYSMFVYLLEALSKSEDQYTPAWQDYDQRCDSNWSAYLSRWNLLSPRIFGQFYWMGLS